MALIKSISGIRGTIGGMAGKNLTPVDIIACCAAFGTWLKDSGRGDKVVIGRDARISGSSVAELAKQTMVSLGLDVVDLGLSTTPTVEMMVMHDHRALGGVIITASHNPEEWNALKFLNQNGEFISAEAGQAILDIIAEESYIFAGVHELGKVIKKSDSIEIHIQKIFELDLVKLDYVRERKFKVAVDCVNSTGSISIVPMLEQMGCEVYAIHDDLSGRFAHNPEPLPAHLQDLSALVVQQGCDLGIAVDPDVDRIAFVNNDGSMFGEEYTIVALADYILSRTGGDTVSNLSSTRALQDITEDHGYRYYASAVGEVNVVKKMKEVSAVFGGEGNGGVIYPALHYGRDALVGAALLLSYLCEREISMVELRQELPQYIIDKSKVSLTEGIEPDRVIEEMKLKYKDERMDLTDGLKLLLDKEWVHMRKSNTEPIIRIYAESLSAAKARQLGDRFSKEIQNICQRIDKN